MKRIVILLSAILMVQLASSQDLIFNSQEQIDSFQVNYPGLTEWGSIAISGNDIYNLDGLNTITSIYNFLIIVQCDNLSNLSGLQNLNHIGITAGLAIGLSIEDCDALKNLNGLSGLTEIDGRIEIYSNDSLKSLSGLHNLLTVGDGLFIEYNSSLKSISALSNLTSIGMDGIIIVNNPLLTNLIGLENIDGASVEYLNISSNDVLSYCHVQSVCDYLVSPNGTTDIIGNAFGCNGIWQVEESCFVSIDEKELVSISIHPNPSDNGKITLTIEDDEPNLFLSCFNTYGQKTYHQYLQNRDNLIDISRWSPGIYIAVLTEQGIPIARSKFVVR